MNIVLISLIFFLFLSRKLVYLEEHKSESPLPAKEWSFTVLLSRLIRHQRKVTLESFVFVAISEVEVHGLLALLL